MLRLSAVAGILVRTPWHADAPSFAQNAGRWKPQAPADIAAGSPLQVSRDGVFFLPAPRIQALLPACSGPKQGQLPRCGWA